MVIDLRRGPARRCHARAHLARSDQHGIGIERAVPHRVAGQRIERVVLEDHQPPAGARHPAQFTQPAQMLGLGDVVEDAGGEADVETGIGGGNAARTDQKLRLARAVQALRGGKAGGRHIRRADRRAGEILAQGGQRIAHAAAEIKDLRVAIAPAPRHAGQFADLVRGEIARRFPRQADAVRVLRGVVADIAVEFCVKHAVSFGWWRAGSGIAPNLGKSLSHRG